MKFRHLAGAARIVLGMFIGVYAWAYFGPEVEPLYRDVIVPVEVLVKSEPDTVVQFKERIVYRTVAPEQRAVAPGGAAATVDSFCAEQAAVEPSDSAGSEAPASSSAVPALIRSGRYSGNTLTLWEVQADGGLAVETFKGVRAPFQFSIGERALVQSSRWWWVDDAVKGAIVFGGGFVAGRVF